MSKFLLNILLQISKVLVNSKIQFLIQKFFFLTFGPADLTAHSAFGPAGPRWPPFSRRPKPTGRPIPLSPRIDSVFAEIRFPFWLAPSELAASSSSLYQAGPGYQLSPSPLAARACPRRHRSLATTRRPAPCLGCRRAVTPHLHSPLIPLLNPPPPRLQWR
jgi:hypothetical protein